MVAITDKTKIHTLIAALTSQLSRIRILALAFVLAWGTLSNQSLAVDELPISTPVGHFEHAPPQLRETNHQWFELEHSLTFIDPNKKHWSAPQGTLTDGASIPSIFIPIIGEKADQSYLSAAIIHDAYCQKENKNNPVYQSEPWEQVHEMFYHAAVASGTPPLKARVMYAAIYLGGPRWQTPKRDISHVPKSRLIQELKWCIQLIEDRNATTEDVTNWMRSREENLRSGRIVKPSWAK